MYRPVFLRIRRSKAIMNFKELTTYRLLELTRSFEFEKESKSILLKMDFHSADRLFYAGFLLKCVH